MGHYSNRSMNSASPSSRSAGSFRDASKGLSSTARLAPPSPRYVRYWILRSRSAVHRLDETAVEIGEGLGFGCVADLGAGRMGFYKLDSLRIDGPVVSSLHGGELAFATRRPKTFPASVGSNSQSAQHAPNRIVVLLSFFKRLDDQSDVSFGRDQAVGSLIEGTTGRGTTGLSLREENEAIDFVVRCATDDRSFDVARLKVDGG